MSKAGPLTRSISRRVRPAEPPTGNDNHANAVDVHSNAQFLQPSGRLGRRLYSDETVIGLALGSPRQNPSLALLPDTCNVDGPSRCSSPEIPVSTLGKVCEIGSEGKGIRRKCSKWKSLGSFFGRREARFASPIHQLDQKQQRGPGKQFVAQVDLSTGMPGAGRSGLLRRNSSRRRGLRRRKVGEPQSEMRQTPANDTAPARAFDPRAEQQGPWTPGPSLLQVEIPCVELERYSVMFGDVLKPQVQQSKPKPSLLARRQAHLEQLHTVADSNSQPFDLDLPESIMRAGSISSHSSKSPSFSLSPSTPPLSARSLAQKLLPKPSLLSRSVTAPGHHLFSPRPAIRKSKSQDQDHVLVIIHNSEDIPGTPTSHGRQPSSDHSQRSANSTTASFFECAEYPGYSYPTIETDSSTPTKGAGQNFLHRPFPARKSSLKKLPSPEPWYRHQGEDPIGLAAEVSVARQISISRRQRQLLVPIVAKTARQPMQLRINECCSTEESRKLHYLTLEDA